MNILMVNWSWYPSGGDWTAVENLNKLYEQRGHNVIPFAMKDERNYSTTYDKYFVDHIDYKYLNNNKSIINGIKVLQRSIYSFQSRKNLKKLLNDINIDIAHLHNLGPQITFSILSLLKERGIPIIMTLHDYSLLCPAVSFVSNNEICERCKGGKYYYSFARRCKKNSYSASLVSAMNSYFIALSKFQKYIDYFICPSKFLRRKFVEYGFDEKRFIQIYNPYDYENLLTLDYKPSQILSNYILYVGRVERIKGVITLLKAMTSISHVDLLIVGSGDADEECKRFIEKNKLTNTKMLGQQDRNTVLSLINGSICTVCPSEWYENLPFSVIESMLMGKPVIGSALGGIPELVLDGTTGLLFKSGNVEDLKEKVLYLTKHRNLSEQYGKQAKEHVVKLVNYNSYYTAIEKIFHSLNKG